MSMNSEQAKRAAKKRWELRPYRSCEVCGEEHRCRLVEVENIEEGVRTLTGLFEKSVRGVVVKKEPERKAG
jgi:hypothetical protein